MGRGYELKLINDYKFDETVSALQKCVRRGREFDACYWAAILYKSGFSKYLARRLRVIAHEDVGIANPQALLLANQLYQDSTYRKVDKKFEESQERSDGFLQYANLIVLMCRGKKTRMADEITNLIFEEIEKNASSRELEELFLDVHTDKGKSKYGRWDSQDPEKRRVRIRKWFSTWSRLENEWKGRNPYKQMLKKLWGYYEKS